MKKYVIVLMLMAFWFATASASKYMNIDVSNGNTENIEISSIKTIVFSEGKMQINFVQGGSNSMIISEIRKIGFDNLNDMKRTVESENLIVYPNPVSDVLHIENKNGTTLRIELFSLDGKKLKAKISSEEIHNLDVTTLKSGLYILKAGDMTFKISKK